MKLSFVTRPMDKLSKNSIDQLRLLTKQKNSSMRRYLLEYEEDPLLRDLAVMIVKDNNHYVGWSLMDLVSGHIAEVQLFVHSDYRRLGVGKKLFNRSLKYLRTKHIDEIRVFPWNARSEKFFKSCGCFSYSIWGASTNPK